LILGVFSNNDKIPVNGYNSGKEKAVKEKLLILMLVLGLASTANAYIELSVNGDTTVEEVDLYIGESLVIGVHGSAAESYSTIIIIEGDPGGGGEWGDSGAAAPGYYYEAGYPVVLPAAGDMAGAGRYEDAGWGFGYWLIAEQSVGSVPAGLHFELLYRCRGPENEYVTISLWRDFGLAEDTIVIHQIPEPATICLLALGGLLLLRRRK
jgi:hypothetical protein